MNRRKFLKGAGLTAGAGIGAAGWLRGTGGDSSGAGTAVLGATTNDTTADSTTPGDSVAPARAVSGTRRLVVVELDGGNDGLNTLVPYTSGRYRDLRPRVAVAPGDVIELAGGWGLHKNLARLHQQGLAVVQGIGSMNPDGSHFEMMNRWWRGDPDGTLPPGTGFFGRLADIIGSTDAAAVAISIGSGASPALVSQKVTTLALPSPDAGGYLVGADPNDQARSSFQKGFAAMVLGGSDERLAMARAVGAGAIDFATTLTKLAADDGGDYPGGNLSDGLRLAGRLLASDPGVRIVHIPAGMDFDTHSDHVGRHPQLLDSIDAAVAAFLADMDRRGLGDDVLVMTTSEFGRTAKDNESNGLDHGTASVALLAGAVKPGIYGEASSLDKLDENDQLVATMGLDGYYATIAERWFEVPAGDVVAGKPKLIDGLLS
jgi:uncharacterized protein (DUF1501 family)